MSFFFKTHKHINIRILQLVDKIWSVYQLDREAHLVTKPFRVNSAYKFPSFDMDSLKSKFSMIITYIFNNLLKNTGYISD